jgi:hypothetical protein
MVNACGVRTRCGGTAEGEVPFEEICVQRGGVEVWRGVGGKFGGFFYYGLEKRAISRGLLYRLALVVVRTNALNRWAFGVKLPDCGHFGM